MPMTFEEFSALVETGFKPALVEPIADNLRRLIVDRMPAALERVQYGPDGAGPGDAVLQGIAADYNSEIGVYQEATPSLVVVPLASDAETNGDANLHIQQHKIHVEVGVARNISPKTAKEDSERFTADLHIYVRALAWIILNLTEAELIEGIENCGGLGWELSGYEYSLYQVSKTKANLFKRSASLTVTVTIIER